MAASSATRSNDVFVGFGARDGVSGNHGGTMASSEADSLYYGLHRELMDAGCFEPAPWSEIGSMIFVVSAFGLGYLALLGDPATVPRLAALALIAFASVQAGFIAHGTGHGTVTRNRWAAVVIGQFFMTFLTVLTDGHFQDIHTRHHAHCNRRSDDPDMQSGAFSMYLESALEKRGLGWLVTRYQSVLIWILVSLQGFTLKLDSVRFMCREPRRARVDWLVLPLHLALWFGPPVYVLGFPDAAMNYALMTLFLGPYLGAIFLVSHIGTEVIEPDDDISFFAQQISTTRNLGTSRIADFLTGGLSNHIEHHLFPTLPRKGLRRARTITRDFCQRHGIAYRETSWLRAAAEVSRFFREVAENARTIRRQARTTVGIGALNKGKRGVGADHAGQVLATCRSSTMMLNEIEMRSPSP